VKLTEDAGTGVQSKASTKFIERMAKHPDGWDLVKKVSHGSCVHEGFYLVFWCAFGADLASPWMWFSDRWAPIFFLQGLGALFLSSLSWALRLITYLKFNPLFT
jgi:hypothetical protein